MSSTAQHVLVVFGVLAWHSRQPHRRRFQRPSKTCASESAAFSSVFMWRLDGRRHRRQLTLMHGMPGGSQWHQLRATPHQQDAKRLPTLTTAVKLHAALQQQEEWSGVSLSQVRRAVTAANERDTPGLIEEARYRRRSIQKRLSETRPAAYPVQLQRKRDAKREARRPQLEARQLERAHSKAQRAAAVAIAKWAYDMSLDEERLAREYDADDLWYLKERRLDAASTLRIARGAYETPRWELPACKRRPVYKRPSATRPQKAPCDSDDSDAQLAELVRDYGPTPSPLPPLPPAALQPTPPPPPLVASPQPPAPPAPLPQPPPPAASQPLSSAMHYRCRGIGCYLCDYSGDATKINMLCVGCTTQDLSVPCECSF